MIVFVLLGALIVLAILLVLLLRFCIKCSPRAAKVYNFIKSKLLYGVFIRYVLLGGVKIQIETGNQMFVGLTIPDTHENEPATTVQLVLGVTTMAIFTLCPILFWVILARNRKNLDLAPVKTKIGALYFGLDAKKPKVVSYSPVFMHRRTLFIAITFGLYGYPGL